MKTSRAFIAAACVGCVVALNSAVLAQTNAGLLGQRNLGLNFPLTSFLDLGVSGSYESFSDYSVARAPVYYQDGLSAAQRRLLREIAMELQVQAFKPGAVGEADASLIFFSPETARVRLPKDLPPAHAEKVTAYQTEKAALKTQLRDTLFQQDRSTKSARVHALKQLATAHAPRFAALVSRCLPRSNRPA